MRWIKTSNCAIDPSGICGGHSTECSLAPGARRSGGCDNRTICPSLGNVFRRALGKRPGSRGLAAVFPFPPCRARGPGFPTSAEVAAGAVCCNGAFRRWRKKTFLSRTEPTAGGFHWCDLSAGAVPADRTSMAAGTFPSYAAPDLWPTGAVASWRPFVSNAPSLVVAARRGLSLATSRL